MLYGLEKDFRESLYSNNNKTRQIYDHDQKRWGIRKRLYKNNLNDIWQAFVFIMIPDYKQANDSGKITNNCIYLDLKSYLFKNIAPRRRFDKFYW